MFFFFLLTVSWLKSFLKVYDTDIIGLFYKFFIYFYPFNWVSNQLNGTLLD